MSGACDRDSTSTNAASRATPPTSSAMTSNEPQPSGSARMKPSMMASRPEVLSSAPATSKVRAAPSSEALLSRRMKNDAAITRMANGTLTRNTQRQLRLSTSAPPTTAPMVPPSPARPPQMPSAMLRRRPCSKVTVSRVRADAESMAPPSPWIPRNRMSSNAVLASPAASDDPAKATSPITNTSRRPIRSAMRPPSSRNPPKMSVYALMTHCRSLAPNFRSDWMCGSATFTIVTSSTTMNWAIASTTRVLQGLFLIGHSLVSAAALCNVHVQRTSTVYRAQHPGEKRPRRQSPTGRMPRVPATRKSRPCAK